MGYNRKVMHRAYAKRALMRLPPLEQHDQTVKN